MKKLLLLFAFISFNLSAQKSIVNFYYGFNESLGYEQLFEVKNGYIGFGFAGTTEESKALGQFKTGSISEWDLKNKVGTTKQKWFNLYVPFSFGYLGKFLISYEVGIGMYGRHANFMYPNPTTLEPEYYHKKDKLLFGPTIGINASYQINKAIGWQIGFDTFSGVNTGFCVYF